MRRKKKKSSFGLAISIVISLIIVILILNYFIFNFQNDSDTKNSINNTLNNISLNIASDDQEIQRYYIGKDIDFLQGKLTNFKIEGLKYYFIFKSDNGEQFYLVSAKIDLNKYLGRDIILKGKVKDFYKNIPVIDVIEVYSEQQDKIETNPNYYEFLSYGLKIDFSNLTGYYTLQNGGFIVIKKIDTINTGIILSGNNIDYISGDKLSGEDLMKIKGFICYDKGNFFKNCKDLEKFSKAAQEDNFVSVNNIKFYKIPESKQWIGVSPGYIWGYLITPENDDILIKLSDTLIPFTTGDLKVKLLKVYKDVCKDSTKQLDILKKIKFEKENNKLYAIFYGLDGQNNNLVCKVLLNFDNNILNTSLEYIKYVISENEIENSNSMEDILKINLENFTGLVASFKAGFTLYIPYKKLFYGQVDLDSKDLGVVGLKCDIQVNISEKVEELLTNPKIKIYRCKTDIDKDNLDKFFPEDVIKKVGNYYFIFKVLDTDWKKLAEDIVVE